MSKTPTRIRNLAYRARYTRLTATISSASRNEKLRTVPTDELRPEYPRADFGAFVRGKYVEPIRERSNVVVLDPEVAELFPNAASVNAALRALVQIANRSGRSRRRST